jgi:hypothetical protein
LLLLTHTTNRLTGAAYPTAARVLTGPETHSYLLDRSAEADGLRHSTAMFVVRAIHTFSAEHGDELEFHAGENIEVLEKDEAFGDGWWRVSFLVPF